MKLSRLVRDESGVTAIEYCLLASMIALGIVAAVQNSGKKVAGSMEDVQAGLTDDSDGPGKGKKKGKKK